jgi:hypothetical protein
MKAFLVLFLSATTLGVVVLSAACTPTGSGSIDPTFQPYANSFQADRARVTGSAFGLGDLTIRFSQPGEMTNSETGVCVFATSTILIDPGFWAAKTELDRTILIYHEMGHCVLLRYHHRLDTLPWTGAWTPDQGWNTEYVSIMNPYALIFPGYYASNREALLTELFTVH